jgi:hypothetical protein
MLALTLAVALACELDQRAVDVTEGELSERGERTPDDALDEGRTTSGSREPGGGQSATAEGSSGSGGQAAPTPAAVPPSMNGGASGLGVAGSSALGSAGAASTTEAPPVASGGATGSGADTMMGASGAPPVTAPPVTAPAVTPPPVTAPPVNAPPAPEQPQAPSPAPPSPAPSVPPSNCPGQFLCDDFEGVASGAAPNPTLWQLIAGFAPATQSANVQVSNQQAHTGAQSLRVVGSSARNGIVATLPQSRYFVRAWLLVDATPVGPVFIGAGTSQNSETRLRVQGQSFATLNTVGPGDAVRPTAATSGSCADCVTLSANEWFCAELFIDNAAQEATLWINGQEAASIVNGQGGWPEQPAQPALFLGSMGLQGGQAGVFIDDVAAGPVRIGCD